MASTEKKSEEAIAVLSLSREAIDEAQSAKQAAESSVVVNNLIADPPLEFTMQVGHLEARVRTLEARLSMLTTPPQNIGGPTPPETIAATMVGGIFNCPECGLRIISPALIATQGLKAGGYYEHPFEESPRLAGQKCRLIGRKFKSPVVHLEFIPTPAPKKLDVQETIGV